MNIIEIERDKKLKEQIKNDLKLVKIQAEIRKNNEIKLEEDLGVQKSLHEFHKPLTEKLDKHNELRIENLKGIQKSIESATEEFAHKPQLDYTFDAMNLMDEAEGFVRLNLNKNLNKSVIEEEGFKLPNELFNKSDEELEEIITGAKEVRDFYKRKKGQVTRARNIEQDSNVKKKWNDDRDLADFKMNQMKLYIKALNSIKTGNEYLGEGVNNHLEILDKFTDKLCKRTKNKKIYNQVVILLDKLLRNGTVTKEFVKEYYKKFLV